jgi:hypothetical protein
MSDANTEAAKAALRRIGIDPDLKCNHTPALEASMIEVQRAVDDEGLRVKLVFNLMDWQSVRRSLAYLAARVKTENDVRNVLLVADCLRHHIIAGNVE